MSKPKQADQIELTLERILWHQIVRDLPNSQVAMRSLVFRQSRYKLWKDTIDSYSDEEFCLNLPPDYKTSQILQFTPQDMCRVAGRFPLEFKRPRKYEDAVVKYLLALKLAGASTGQGAQHALDQLSFFAPSNMRKRMLKKSTIELESVQTELDAHFMETLMRDGA